MYIFYYIYICICFFSIVILILCCDRNTNVYWINSSISVPVKHSISPSLIVFHIVFCVNLAE